MGARGHHEVTLSRPLALEELFARLLPLLPKLLRFYVRENDVELRGLDTPLAEVTSRSATEHVCTEHFVTATLKYVDVEREGVVHRSLALSVLAHRFHGMYVFDLFTASTPVVTQVTLECRYDEREPVKALLASAL
ncbi:MAG: hypothetical protein QM817_39370 [Archangium sp.]